MHVYANLRMGVDIDSLGKQEPPGGQTVIMCMMAAQLIELTSVSQYDCDRGYYITPAVLNRKSCDVCFFWGEMRFI